MFEYLEGLMLSNTLIDATNQNSSNDHSEIYERYFPACPNLININVVLQYKIILNDTTLFCKQFDLIQLTSKFYYNTRSNIITSIYFACILTLSHWHQNSITILHQTWWHQFILHASWPFPTDINVVLRHKQCCVA